MLTRMEPPTRLPPPPRHVSGGAGCAIWFGRLFILPHTIVGLFLLGHLAMSFLVAALGTDLRAEVTQTHTSRGSKGSISYQVQYNYAAGDMHYKSSGSVQARTYARLDRPQSAEATGPLPTVGIRLLQMGPLHYHLLTEDRSAWREGLDSLFIALFWNGILSVFIILLWIAPIRARSLVRHGQVAVGTVVKTRVNRGKSYTYYATFQFRNPENGAEIEKEMSVPKARFDDAIPGRVVTVIYDLRKPRRAIAYELSEYKVTGSAGLD
jgi:hypothetical protein